MLRATWKTFLVILLVSLCGLPALAQAQRPPEKKPSKAPGRERIVWTNDEIELLAKRVPLSDLGPGNALTTEAPAASGQAPPAGTGGATAGTPGYSRENDPEWYRQRATALRAEIDRVDSELRRLREFRNNPNMGQAGLTLGTDNISQTPENQIQQLEQRRARAQQELDDLEAAARRKGWPPGATR
jgi:uncharacterized small protein (DUF1192 family)